VSMLYIDVNCNTTEHEKKYQMKSNSSNFIKKSNEYAIRDEIQARTGNDNKLNKIKTSGTGYKCRNTTIYSFINHTLLRASSAVALVLGSKSSNGVMKDAIP
jgi:hypothetical protein